MLAASAHASADDLAAERGAEPLELAGDPLGAGDQVAGVDVCPAGLAVAEVHAKPGVVAVGQGRLGAIADEADVGCGEGHRRQSCGGCGAQPGTGRVAPAGEGTPRTAGVVASVAALPAETLDQLVDTLAERRRVERLDEASRGDLAAALARARSEGAQVNELARFCGLSKPTMYRLLGEHAAGQPKQGGS